ncbi:MAG: Wzz/FepE/Etk N-terminal domain-containing protein [Acetivibrionales bacterium]
MTEISIKDIFGMLVRRWWIILVFAVVFGAAVYIRTNFFAVPLYNASTTLYVGKNTDQFGIENADLNLGSSLILDYREIAKSRLVAYEVLDELGLGMSAEEMSDKIMVDQKDTTRVIEITVKDSDPQMAMDIANTVAEVFRRKVADIMQIENVQIIDTAELPELPVSPQKRVNYAVGVLLGLMAGFGLVFLIEFLDDTVKTPEDVLKHTGFVVIGTIPVFSRKGRLEYARC